MRITGERRVAVSREDIWDAIHDLGVLRATVPGCQELEQTGPNTYSGAATVGIAVIKGLYRGTLTLLEEEEPAHLNIAVSAKSGHAEIKGEGTLTLEAVDGGTLLCYEGDARISGPIAAIGQRLLPAASKTITEQFFRNLEGKLLPGSQ